MFVADFPLSRESIPVLGQDGLDVHDGVLHQLRELVQWEEGEFEVGYRVHLNKLTGVRVYQVKNLHNQEGLSTF